MKRNRSRSAGRGTHQESYTLFSKQSQNCCNTSLCLKNLVLLMLLIALCLPSASQNNKIVVKINDAMLVKKLCRQNHADVLLKPAYLHLGTTLKKYRVSEIRQLYPDALTADLHRYFLITADESEKLMNELKRNCSDVFSNIRAYFEPVSLYSPNDYDFTLQYGIGGRRPVGLTYLDLIRAREAWDITKGNPGVVVGIYDNHLYEKHEDLKGKIVKIYDDNVRDDFSKKPDHGTMVAGLIAANSNNHCGIASIAQNCKIAKTSKDKNDLFKMAEDGIKIINISQDWGPYCEEDQQIINELTYDYGVSIVASTGNKDATTYVYPASYDNVISVTSVGHEFERGTAISDNQFNYKDCHKGSFGTNEILVTHTHNDKVDICAPGYNIITLCHPETYINGLGQATGQLYDIQSGTSFAAPLVSGVIALMYSVNPDLTPKEVEDILKSTAVNIYDIPENKEYEGMLGAGRVDAYAAVKETYNRLYPPGPVSSINSAMEKEPKVYPNPTQGKVYFSNTEDFDEVSVYDALGHLIQKQHLEFGNQYISIENENPGMYIFIFSGENNIIHREKILKK